MSSLEQALPAIDAALPMRGNRGTDAFRKLQSTRLPRIGLSAQTQPARGKRKASSSDVPAVQARPVADRPAAVAQPAPTRQRRFHEPAPTSVAPSVEPVASDAVAAAVARAAASYTSADYRRELARVKRKRVLVGVLVALAVVLLATCVAFAIALNTVWSTTQVVGSKMSPTLENGQVVLVQPTDGVSAGDVVAYKDDEDAEMFGRVFAGPGEWVTVLTDDSALVSDHRLTTDEAQVMANGNVSIVQTRQIPVASYFVLMDGTPLSEADLSEARFYVKQDQVTGKALFKIWPIMAIGPIAQVQAD